MYVIKNLMGLKKRKCKEMLILCSIVVIFSRLVVFIIILFKFLIKILCFSECGSVKEKN